VTGRLLTLRSEWGKTWSVRAPGLCLLTTALVVAITATSLANDFVHSTRTGELPYNARAPLMDSLGPALSFGLLVVAAFAMQLVTTEYASNSIRSTLQAQPRRGRVLGAKAFLAGMVSAVAGVVIATGTAAAVRIVLTPSHQGAMSSYPVVAVHSAVLFGLTAMIAVALGTIVRSAVGTLTACFLLLVGTLALPSSLGRWLPGQAGATLMNADQGPYPTGVAILVLVVWTCLLLCVALWSFLMRDA
jgi:ABC-2 type transport system permease protein